MDELLQKFNLKRETLTTDEVLTLEKWSKSLATQQLHVADIRSYLDEMIASIEKNLYSYDTPPMTFANLVFKRRRKRHLEARLHNYILLRDFVTSPEKARAFVEKSLSQMANVKG